MTKCVSYFKALKLNPSLLLRQLWASFVTKEALRRRLA